MTDHFAVLGVERRPAVAELALQGAYYEKTRLLHPDRAQGSDFATVNAAFQVISNPATRIRHLLKLEFGNQEVRQIGNELGGLFGTMAGVLQRADQELASVSGQTSPVIRALAFQRLDSLRDALADAEKQLVERESDLQSQIAAVDQIWFRDRDRCQKSLAQIAADLTFVQKWLAQVRERKTRLEELF